MAAKRPAQKKPPAPKAAARKTAAKPPAHRSPASPAPAKAAAKAAPAKAAAKAAPAKPAPPKHGAKPTVPGGIPAASRPKLAGQVIRAVARPEATAAPAAAGANRWALVTARDLMRTDVVTVSYSAPLSEVERVLADNRISGAPVVDEVGRIIGVVSIRDLVERYAADPDARPRRGAGFFELSTEELEEEDLDAFEVPEEAEETARDVMTAQIHTVPGAAGLKEIADAMCRHKVHRVLVEEEGRLLGLISTLDILEGLRA